MQLTVGRRRRPGIRRRNDYTSPFRRHPVTLPATFGESGSTWRRMCSAVRSTCVCAHGARCSMVTVTRPARTGYGRPRPCGSPLPAPSRRNWDQVNAARTLSPTRQAASTAAASHGFASFFSGCQRRRGLPSRVMRTGSTAGSAKPRRAASFRRSTPPLASGRGRGPRSTCWLSGWRWAASAAPSAPTNSTRCRPRGLEDQVRPRGRRAALRRYPLEQRPQFSSYHSRPVWQSPRAISDATAAPAASRCRPCPRHCAGASLRSSAGPCRARAAAALRRHRHRQATQQRWKAVAARRITDRVRRPADLDGGRAARSRRRRRRRHHPWNCRRGDRIRVG